jgi:GNAT superfamily N-acetyltransferase
LSEVDEEALAAEAPPADLGPPGGAFLLVSVDGAPAAIGGIRGLDTGVAGVKSMYVAPPARGLGLGRRLPASFEAIAAERDCRTVRLDTAAHLEAAIRLYRDIGYREIPAYNRQPEGCRLVRASARLDGRAAAQDAGVEVAAQEPVGRGRGEGEDDADEDHHAADVGEDDREDDDHDDADHSLQPHEAKGPLDLAPQRLVGGRIGLGDSIGRRDGIAAVVDFVGVGHAPTLDG